MEANIHEEYMSAAYKLAEKAYALGDVPIGCVISDGSGRIIGEGYNTRNHNRNALCHAELIAIGMACRNTGDWRLEGCTIYVTIEPCPMCAGAIVQSRIKTAVFGARNRKAGCAGSILDILREPRFNHQTEIIEGVMREECAALMSEFFKRHRETIS